MEGLGRRVKWKGWGGERISVLTRNIRTANAGMGMNQRKPHMMYRAPKAW